MSVNQHLTSVCAEGDTRIITHNLLFHSNPPVGCTLEDSDKWNDHVRNHKPRYGWYPEQVALEGCVSFEVPGA